MTTNRIRQTEQMELSNDQFLDLAHQIASYRRTQNPNGYSDQRVALDIADNMLIVARKHGIRTYTMAEVIKGLPSELQGPFSHGFQRCRSGIFEALCSLPFIMATKPNKTIRLHLEGSSHSKRAEQSE